MTTLISMGMNHETAPVKVRECLATEAENTHEALTFMRSSSCIKEGLFISTCNRVEALITTEQATEAIKALMSMMSRLLMSMMSRLGNLPEKQLSDALYIYENTDAVNHIYRVASSLDSMVVGEPQILGQIKNAYAEATREKTSGVILNRLMHKAFHVAKRIRTETEISAAAVSISYAAVELAKKIFDDLDGKKVLLIGAGEMAELAARHLMRQGINAMSVANRTFERAIQVAEAFGAHPVSFDEIELQLEEVDIVIASTGSPKYVITFDQVKSSRRKRRNRPLFLIDIAVPRDVEPKINELDNIYVYDIDDLQGVIEINLSQRRQEAVKAERIIEEEVIKFDKWLDTLSVVPTIVALREKAEAILQAELKRSNSALGALHPEQYEAVMALTRSIVDKVLNDPILFLKTRADRETVNTYLDVARRLFKLDQDNGNRG
jgi:glutamyl-tRNA reductase